MPQGAANSSPVHPDFQYFMFLRHYLSSWAMVLKASLLLFQIKRPESFSWHPCHTPSTFPHSLKNSKASATALSSQQKSSTIHPPHCQTGHIRTSQTSQDGTCFT